MESWGFFDGQGNEITRGWQGTDRQARQLCQRYADERGDTVECCLEPTMTETVYVCEPRAEVV